MIITKKKAHTIVSNINTIKDIPQLHALFEESKKRTAEFQQQKNCSSCSQRKEDSDLSDRALSAIMALPQESLYKLRAALGMSESLYAYSSTPDGVNLVQLIK